MKGKFLVFLAPILIPSSISLSYTYLHGDNVVERGSWERQKFKSNFCVLCSSDKDRESWDSNWDKRGSILNEEERPDNSSRTLILIRHGQYQMLEELDEKKVLTELGREQARQTGVRLRELNLPISRIVHSNMPRAIETARIISKQLTADIPMEICSLLREGKPYRPQPDTIHRNERYYYQDGARIEAAFRKYFYRSAVEQKENTVEVIVGHSNVIRYFVCRALQVTPDAWLRMRLGNCSLTIITIRPNGEVSLRALGSTGHLRPEMITEFNQVLQYPKTGGH